MKKMLIALSVVIVCFTGCTANPVAIENRIQVTHTEDKFSNIDLYQTTSFNIYSYIPKVFEEYCSVNVEMDLSTGAVKDRAVGYYVNMYIERTAEKIDWVFPLQNKNLIAIIDGKKFELEYATSGKGTVDRGIGKLMKLKENVSYYAPKEFIEALANVQTSFEFKLYGQNSDIEKTADKSPLNDYEKISTQTSAKKILAIQTTTAKN